MEFTLPLIATSQIAMDDTIIATIGTLGFIGVLLFAAAIFAIRNLIRICQPNEALIFSGPSSTTSDGRRVNYHIVKGGRKLYYPLFQRVSRMDLSNIIIDLKVTGAYSKGGIPLMVDGVANVKIAGTEPGIHNAIERFLGKSRGEITMIAKETLEGNLRGVLAQLTPEQVNEDKTAFARSLLDEAEEDLERLGLALDSLKIQDISDNRSYLESIGKIKSAELNRDAAIAQARREAEARVAEAENNRDTRLAQLDAQVVQAKADTERRIIKAQNERSARIAEAQRDVSAKVIESRAEVSVQKARVEEERRRLQADVVAQAEAACEEALARAKGQAAKIIEDGKARVEGLSEMIRSWKDAGSDAREIFLMQKLDNLMTILADTVKPVEVDGVTIIDCGSDNQAIKTAAFLEQLRHASGIDLAGLAQSLTAGRGKLSAGDQDA